MEVGKGFYWLDSMMDEIESAIAKVDDIRKKLEAVGSNIWSDFIEEMNKPPSYYEAAERSKIFRPEEQSSEDNKPVTTVVKETTKISDSMVQEKKEASESDVSVSDSAKLDEANSAMNYISTWFLHHTEEDSKIFVMAVASHLKLKGRPDLAAEVEKLLAVHTRKLTEAFAKYGRTQSDSVEDGEQSEIDFSGGEQVLSYDGNRSEAVIETVDELPLLHLLDESIFYKDFGDYSEREKAIMKKWKRPVFPLHHFGEYQPSDEDADNSSEEEKDETSYIEDTEDASEDETSYIEDTEYTYEDETSYAEDASEDETVEAPGDEDMGLLGQGGSTYEDLLHRYGEVKEEIARLRQMIQALGYSEMLQQELESSDEDIGFSCSGEEDEEDDVGYIHWTPGQRSDYQGDDALSSDEDIGGAGAAAAAGANDAAEEEEMPETEWLFV